MDAFDGAQTHNLHIMDVQPTVSRHPFKQWQVSILFEAHTLYSIVILVSHVNKCTKCMCNNQ